MSHGQPCTIPNSFEPDNSNSTILPLADERARHPRPRPAAHRTPGQPRHSTRHGVFRPHHTRRAAHQCTGGAWFSRAQRRTRHLHGPLPRRTKCLRGLRHDLRRIASDPQPVGTRHVPAVHRGRQAWREASEDHGSTCRKDLSLLFERAQRRWAPPQQIPVPNTSDAATHATQLHGTCTGRTQRQPSRDRQLYAAGAPCRGARRGHDLFDRPGRAVVDDHQSVRADVVGHSRIIVAGDLGQAGSKTVE